VKLSAWKKSPVKLLVRAGLDLDRMVVRTEFERVLRIFRHGSLDRRSGRLGRRRAAVLHDFRARRPRLGVDRLDGIATAEAIGDAREARAFFHAQAVLLAVGFEGTVPLAQKDLSILDGPKEGQ